jgi:hypothetical protein
MWAPIFTIAQYGKQPAMLSLLVKYGVSVDSRFTGGMMATQETPLLMAAMKCNVPAVRLLLSLGANRKLKDWRNHSAVDAATEV